MEFIEGQTLEDRIKEGPLNLEEAVRIASEIAKGLKAAHAKDIVHRDIKAANVMLDLEGRAKILDFGLALTAQSTKLTRMGSTLGTVAYMSPEQARGEEVDARTDIWALGVTMHEMIAGTHPFGGDYEQAVVYSIMNEDPQPLTAVRTGIPMGLEWIVSKCLSKQTKDRYQNANDLLVDLRNVDLNDAGISRIRTTDQSMRMRAATSSPLQLIEKIKNTWLIIIGAIILTFVGTFFAINSTDVNPGYRSLPLSIPGIRQLEDITMSPDKSRIVFQGADSTGRFGMYELPLDGSDKVLYYEGSREAVWPRYSPNGRLLIHSQFDELGYRRYEVGKPTGTGRDIPGTQGMVIGDWLSDEHIVSTREDSLFSISVTDGTANLLTVAEPGHRFGVVSDVSTDQNFALLEVLDDENRKNQALFDFEKGDYKIIEPNATWGKFVGDEFIMFSKTDPTTGAEISQNARRFDRKRRELTGSPIPLGENQPSYAYGIGAGTTMLHSPSATSQETVILKRDLDASGRSSVIVSADIENWDIRVSRDGSSLLYAEQVPNSELRKIVVWDLDTGTPRTVIQADSIMQVVWSSNERRLYYGRISDGVSQIVEAPVNRPQALDTVFVGAHYFGLSPDNRLLAIHDGPRGQDGLKIKNLESQEEFIVESGQVHRYSSFSEDGRYIAYSRRTNARWALLIRDLVNGDEHIIEDGSSPEWDHLNNKLYYSDTHGLVLYSVSVTTDQGFQLGPAVDVFPTGRGSYFRIDAPNNMAYGATGRYTDFAGPDSRINMWENYDDYLRARLVDH